MGQAAVMITERLKNLKKGTLLLAMLVMASVSLLAFHVHADSHCCPSELFRISDYQGSDSGDSCVICQAVRTLGNSLPAGTALLEDVQNVSPFTASEQDIVLPSTLISKSGRSPPPTV